jgi:aerotaxis receptor
VKKRRKNGDCYWVRANVTPMRDGERITGYLSVRTRADRPDIVEAERLYATMRDEQAAGRQRHALARGKVVRGGLRGWAARLLRLGTAGQLLALQLLTATCTVAAARLPFAGALPAAGAIAAAAAWALWGMTARPLRAIVDDANRLASGDLSHTVATGTAEPPARSSTR